eukprot:CAMPEP_0184969172 /NCGR_PEP_ID=MMETSP1098-20130426/2003_1 /TAXON_ID=89044 /ORGANISM="Spumella elongata, Strain CCAP 955/1" /LENGTH=341 /DNA_ID=CAMNT_0027490909 /DNA_START=36 /DNA_END=1058 /DNA_ORIENTATION=+
MVSTCSIVVLLIAIGWAVLTKAQQSDHLVVLSHGLHGSRHDLTYLADHLEKAGCLVLRSSANEMLNSHVGVHAGGMKLADEVWNFLYLHSGVRRISFVGNSLGGLFARYAVKELFDEPTGLIATLRPHHFLTIATPHLGVRNYTFFDEFGIQVPSQLKDLVARGMGRTGLDMLGDDPNQLGSESLIYRMATSHEFLEPLRAFQSRRLLANLNLDLMVPLGTAAFLEHEEVLRLRAQHSEVPGIVQILTTHPVTPDMDLAQSCADNQCANVGVKGSSNQLLPIDEMRKSLDQLGWIKVIVNFKGVFPMAHNQIAAVTKFTTEIDRLLGFHEGRYLIDKVAQW